MDMSINLMPYVLVVELVTRMEVEVRVEKEEGGQLGSGPCYEVGNENLDSIYRLVRNCQVLEMFNFPSPESKMHQQEEKTRQPEAEKVSPNLVNNTILLWDGCNI